MGTFSEAALPREERESRAEALVNQEFRNQFSSPEFVGALG